MDMMPRVNCVNWDFDLHLEVSISPFHPYIKSMGISNQSYLIQVDEIFLRRLDACLCGRAVFQFKFFRCSQLHVYRCVKKKSTSSKRLSTSRSGFKYEVFC